MDTAGQMMWSVLNPTSKGANHCIRLAVDHRCIHPLRQSDDTAVMPLQLLVGPFSPLLGYQF